MNMKNLILLGAGGLGKEIYGVALQSKGYGQEFVVKGFLDFPKEDWPSIYPPILGLEDDYEIQPDDVFICAVGDVPTKKRICEKIIAKGGKFWTLVHTLAQILPGAVLGEGTIVDSFAVIGSDAVIGSHCLIQIGAVVGHEACVGDFTRIDCHVVVVGGVQVGREVTIHTGSVINHKVVVEDNSKVGALSFVVRRVRKGTIVQGNPAQRLYLPPGRNQ